LAESERTSSKYKDHISQLELINSNLSMDLENLKNHVRKNESIINRLNEEFEEKENMYNEIAVKLEEKEFEISSLNQ